MIKVSIYYTQVLRCLLLKLSERDRLISLLANKLISVHLSDRKDIFYDQEIQKTDLEDFEKTKTKIEQIKNQMYQSS